MQPQEDLDKTTALMLEMFQGASSPSARGGRRLYERLSSTNSTAAAGEDEASTADYYTTPPAAAPKPQQSAAPAAAASSGQPLESHALSSRKQPKPGAGKQRLPRNADHSHSHNHSNSHHHPGRFVNVLLLKCIPWEAPLADIAAAIDTYAKLQGSSLIKELVPVWDREMALAELSSPIKVAGTDHAVVCGKKITIEAAKNPEVAISPSSAVLQIRCIILCPGTDYTSTDLAADKRAYEAVFSNPCRLTLSAARHIADQIDPHWEDVVVPPISMRVTRQEQHKDKRKYAQLLLKTANKAVAEVIKKGTDGVKLDLFGVRAVVRIEYSHSSYLYTKENKWAGQGRAEKHRLTLSRSQYEASSLTTGDTDDPHRTVRTWSDVFEECQAEPAVAQPAKEKVRARKSDAGNAYYNPPALSPSRSGDAPPSESSNWGQKPAEPVQRRPVQDTTEGPTAVGGSTFPMQLYPQMVGGLGMQPLFLPAAPQNLAQLQQLQQLLLQQSLSLMFNPAAALPMALPSTADAAPAAQQPFGFFPFQLPSDAAAPQAGEIPMFPMQLNPNFHPPSQQR
ncbi:hypothetical protein DIPPA_31649 [Diplonema papillatum]|nr:hypothetical protein DIPPA_21656 [Diplonema papillatum]KAJ9446156.1 hypothetical protein DIPPA_31649 [Diplonema papillatum]